MSLRRSSVPPRRRTLLHASLPLQPMSEESGLGLLDDGRGRSLRSGMGGARRGDQVSLLLRVLKDFVRPLWISPPHGRRRDADLRSGGPAGRGFRPTAGDASLRGGSSVLGPDRRRTPGLRGLSARHGRLRAPRDAAPPRSARRDSGKLPVREDPFRSRRAVTARASLSLPAMPACSRCRLRQQSHHRCRASSLDGGRRSRASIPTSRGAPLPAGLLRILRFGGSGRRAGTGFRDRAAGRTR